MFYLSVCDFTKRLSVHSGSTEVCTRGSHPRKEDWHAFGGLCVSRALGNRLREDGSHVSLFSSHLERSVDTNEQAQAETEQAQAETALEEDMTKAEFLEGQADKLVIQAIWNKLTRQSCPFQKL
eukprot:1941482-Amphidinium_carterae.1